MKSLKFEHAVAIEIREGERRSTLRIDDKDIHVGERLQVVDKISSNKPREWEVFGEILISMVQEFRLGSLPKGIMEQTELGDSNKDQLYVFLRRFYGENVGDDTIVKLISFDFSPYDQPVKYLAQEELQGAKPPETVVLYADGGSRGNPGPSASGFVVEDIEGNVLENNNKYIGITTNNQAEYHALVAGLEWCHAHQVQKVHVRLDSLLVVNQMKGIYKVKNRDLWTLYETAKKMQSKFKEIDFTHVPRELNKLADAEVNKVLDALKGTDIVQ